MNVAHDQAQSGRDFPETLLTLLDDIDDMRVLYVLPEIFP
jgi:hypothetical protein